MAYWEQMKIWQMGELLRQERPDILCTWKNWAERISYFPPDETDRDPLHLNNWPKPLTVYLFAFVAVICAKEHGDPAPSAEKIGDDYHLDLIFDPANNNSWLNAIVVIFPNQNAADCIGYVRDYAKDWTDIGIHTSLQALLDRIRIANRRAYDAGRNNRSLRQERLIIPQCVDHFTGVMDEFDNDWKTHCESHRFQNTTVDTLRSLIENGVRQIILTGAPGTGKTYAARNAAKYLGNPLPEAETPMVQFHPSYDYTDFVEGLRPVQLAGETKSTFVRLDGSFKSFCRSVAEENRKHAPARASNPAAADPRCVDDPDGRLYFFLIDEINRANLSQVFGELMFCLESDKRGLPVQTQYRNLPTYRVGEDRKAAPIDDDVFSDGFFIPRNVVIIGTMNDIDRSVESMDFALRRRFIWHEVTADHALLQSAFESGNFGTILMEHAAEAAERISRLNAAIEQGAQFGLNRHYDITQGQFNLPGFLGDTLDELIRFVWEHRIEPLLREYLRGEDPADVELFVETCADAFGIGDETGRSDMEAQEEG